MRIWRWIARACVVAPLTMSAAVADESGVSFWLPGQFASFAATPLKPGWSFDWTFYHATASANAGANFPRGGRVALGVSSPSQFLMFTPTHAFANELLGAQLELGMTFLVGRNSTSASATLTAPGGPALSGFREEQIVGVGDLTPTAALKWNRGEHNFMLYTTANIPVGAYDPDSLAAIGIGHWAVDGGAGYTFYSESAGVEFSVVSGLTYNFTNPDTNYRSGVDAHVDWAFSPFVSDKMHVGAGGYFYYQLTPDTGASALLGDFKSQVAGIGPQIGFFIPIGEYQGYLNLRAYYDFAAKNRLEGWNAFVSFSIEPPENKSAQRRLR